MSKNNLNLNLSTGIIKWITTCENKFMSVNHSTCFNINNNKKTKYKFFPKNLCPLFMISIDNAHQVECFVVEKCRNGFPDKVVKM